MKSLLGSPFTIIAFIVAFILMFSGVSEMIQQKMSWIELQQVTVSGSDDVLLILAYALPLGILVEISYALKEISHSIKQIKSYLITIRSAEDRYE
tara:strand:- start:149 stop:433 length:285 start_codon:yes stop_codon:yes gene_type:complete